MGNLKETCCTRQAIESLTLLFETRTLMQQLCLIASIGASLSASLAAPRTQVAEWRHYEGDAGGTRYSPLDQINKKNVTQLRVAWSFDTGDVSDGTQYPTRSAFEASPLVVDGVMYVTTPFCRLIPMAVGEIPSKTPLLTEFSTGASTGNIPGA